MSVSVWSVLVKRFADCRSALYFSDQLQHSHASACNLWDVVVDYGALFFIQIAVSNQLNLSSYYLDLSPTEQVWDLMKSKLRWKKFHVSNSLYKALCFAQRSITENILHDLRYTLSGISINGHWKDFHKWHNQIVWFA